MSAPGKIVSWLLQDCHPLVFGTYVRCLFCDVVLPAAIHRIKFILFCDVVLPTEAFLYHGSSYDFDA